MNNELHYSISGDLFEIYFWAQIFGCNSPTGQGRSEFIKVIIYSTEERDVGCDRVLLKRPIGTVSNPPHQGLQVCTGEHREDEKMGIQKLVTREFRREISQIFQWSDLYFCKYCGVRGYYVTEIDESIFCSTCEFTDVLEFCDPATEQLLLDRKSDSITDRREWFEYISKTVEEWRLSDLVSSMEMNDREMKQHQLFQKMYQGLDTGINNNTQDEDETDDESSDE